MLLPPPVLVSTISATEVMSNWEMTSTTGTPFLFILAKRAGRIPCCAVTNIPREGPTIHAAISASTPRSNSAAIPRIAHSKPVPK
ncbi:hypothetical protein D3C81_1576580 [compost metagenome]